MADEWSISLTKDEALVLADYLDRWQRSGSELFPAPVESEREAFNNLLALLERADDGTAFAADYSEQLAAAKKRLTPHD